MEVLYLEGDPCAPKYVEGALRAAGFAVRRGAQGGIAVGRNAMIIVSDVTRDNLGEEGAARIAEAVHGGAGLLLVGGWHSFGSGGWAGTALDKVSPVTVTAGDDRVNQPGGVFLAHAMPHPSVDGLPWDTPPVVTGYNRVRPAPATDVVVQGWIVEEVGAAVVSLARDPVPMLCLGTAGRGRTAAFLGDLAPHWSGGLTDWGGSPVDVGNGEEVGAGYVAFLRQLCAWLAGG